MTDKDTWLFDQLAKSTHFHSKLHEWGLLEVAQQIEQIRGESLDWNDLEELNISKKAWNKVIHNGIKPVQVFAHPEVLQKLPRAVSYYRMLAMVSQKSMNRIGIPVVRFEQGKAPTNEQATKIAQHLNSIISKLIDSDETITMREFDLWRGMAAGTQAQGSWQNAKGNEMENLIKEIIILQIINKYPQSETTPKVHLPDGRTIFFGDDPDIAIYQGNQPIIAIEVKGGIDPAGAYERLGAAIKTLQRVKQQNSSCLTILFLRESALTDNVRDELAKSRDVDEFYTIEKFINDDTLRQELWQRLGL